MAIESAAEVGGDRSKICECFLLETMDGGVSWIPADGGKRLVGEIRVPEIDWFRVVSHAGWL